MGCEWVKGRGRGHKKDGTRERGGVVRTRSCATRGSGCGNDVRASLPSPHAWLIRVPFTRSRRDEPSPYAMDGFSNVTPVTVDDDPLGNQLADAMDGLRCSRSTRAVQPPVVPQQTARQKKVLEELADSMVSHTSSLGTQAHGGWGVAPPGLVRAAA